MDNHNPTKNKKVPGDYFNLTTGATEVTLMLWCSLPHELLQVFFFLLAFMQIWGASNIHLQKPGGRFPNSSVFGGNEPIYICLCASVSGGN